MKTPLLKLLAVSVALLCGCAGARPTNIHAPSNGPSLMQIMERVKRAQTAYARMAEAGNSVAAVLGVTVVDLESAFPRSEPEPSCPSQVQARRDGDERGGYDLDHADRLARALVLLDSELSAAGRGSIGCDD